MHKRMGIAAGALAATALGPAAVAHADTTQPQWNCRASVAWAKLPGLDRVEPLAANGNTATPSTGGPDRPACAADDTPIPQLSLTTPIGLQATALRATTTITPSTGAARDQQVSGTATGADVDLAIPNSSGLHIHATAVRSTASAACSSTTPTLTGSSSVGSLSINGQTLSLDQPVQTISTTLNGSPLAVLAKILPNQQIVTGDASSDTQSLTQQALRVELLNVPGQSAAVTVVLGESKVSRDGATCAAPTDNGGGGTNPGGGDTGGGGTGGGGTTGGGTATTTPGPTVYVPVPVKSNTGTVGTSSVAKAGSPNGTNGGACGHVSMHFGNGKKSFSHTYGKRLVLRGRIVNCKGKSITGARVAVANVINGHKRYLKTGMRSRSGGKLTLILPSNLTTRTMMFDYYGIVGSDKLTSRSTLHLTVRRHNGQILRGPGPGSSRK